MINPGNELVRKISSWPAKYESEDYITNQLAIALKGYVLEGKLEGVFFHVPNEVMMSSQKDMLGAKKKHALGAINGAPDFIFTNGDTTLFVELKVKGGRQSENQRMFEAWCKGYNVRYVICYSVEETINVLNQHGFIKEDCGEL